MSVLTFSTLEHLSVTSMHVLFLGQSLLNDSQFANKQLLALKTRLHVVVFELMLVEARIDLCLLYFRLRQ